MLSVIRKSILAGMLISICAYTYSMCENKVVGAVIFSVGLLSIMRLGLCLFTGKVGFVRDMKSFLVSVLIFIFNVLGCAIISIPVAITSGPYSFMGNRLYLSHPEILVYAIMCGILIYVAVRCNSDIITVLCVAAFILCGAKHSVADAAYAFLSIPYHTPEMLVSYFIDVFEYILVVFIGNAIGSIIFSLLEGYKNIVDESKKILRG